MATSKVILEASLYDDDRAKNAGYPILQFSAYEIHLWSFLCYNNCQWYSLSNSSRSKLCKMIESTNNPRRRKLSSRVHILLLNSLISSLDCASSNSYAYLVLRPYAILQ